MSIHGGGGDGYWPVDGDREPYEQQMRKAAESGGPSDDSRFEHGFLEGFTRARQIFWRDAVRRAKESEFLASQLRASNPAGDAMADSLDSMAAAYMNIADLISKSHTLYPGALQDNFDSRNQQEQTLYYY